jgi:hypothetical protein
MVMQSGQQPSLRNTRLSVMVRNALKGVLGKVTAAKVEKQTEAGNLILNTRLFCYLVKCS